MTAASVAGLVLLAVCLGVWIGLVLADLDSVGRNDLLEVDERLAFDAAVAKPLPVKGMVRGSGPVPTSPPPPVYDFRRDSTTTRRAR